MQNTYIAKSPLNIAYTLAQHNSPLFCLSRTSWKLSPLMQQLFLNKYKRILTQDGRRGRRHSSLNEKWANKLFLQQPLRLRAGGLMHGESSVLFYAYQTTQAALMSATIHFHRTEETHHTILISYISIHPPLPTCEQNMYQKPRKTDADKIL